MEVNSKWENGEGFPDISLLPLIASFYDTSVDELLGCGEMEKEKKIQEYRDRWIANSKEGRQEENIEMLHEALKKFPHDVGLMHDLCFSLEFTHKEEHLDECIEIGKRILEQNTEEEFYRYGAIQRIAYAYHRKNDAENAMKYARMLPNFIHTQSKTLEQILTGEERCRCAQENIMICIKMIDNSVTIMLESGDYSAEERIFARETVIKLYELFLYNGDYYDNNIFLGMLWNRLAYDYAELGDAANTVDAMKKAYAHALAADAPNDRRGTSVFFDHYCGDTIGISNNEQNAHLIDQIRNSASQPEFVFVRHTDEWKEIF